MTKTIVCFCSSIRRYDYGANLLIHIKVITPIPSTLAENRLSPSNCAVFWPIGVLPRDKVLAAKQLIQRCFLVPAGEL
ncbi:hypothetical protein RFM99_29165 [Mesorhizobium sp. VK4C]|uniref:hypothetical protein n=1 Tax=Mesorhizobium captivum TaxID=3072319 RepID=UPI002A2428BE|nr:hypothetical protein [Mesorhizobium sp. VK4C]MDX8502457.1 hypothetical protein [Mesorhizobium sp. VK4C]